MSALWNTDSFKPPSDFKNIMSIDGDVVAVKEIKRPDNFNASGKDKDAVEVSLENIDNIEMKGGADAPKMPDGTFRITFNTSAVEGSLNFAWVAAAQKLVTDVQNDFIGKRVRFVKEVVRLARGQNQEWAILVPTEILGDNNENIEDVIKALMEGANNVKSFKRAALVNPKISASPYMEKIKDDTIFADFGYVIAEDGTYAKE